MHVCEVKWEDVCVCLNTCTGISTSCVWGGEQVYLWISQRGKQPTTHFARAVSQQEWREHERKTNELFQPAECTCCTAWPRLSPCAVVLVCLACFEMCLLAEQLRKLVMPASHAVQWLCERGAGAALFCASSEKGWSAPVYMHEWKGGVFMCGGVCITVRPPLNAAPGW